MLDLRQSLALQQAGWALDRATHIFDRKECQTAIEHLYSCASGMEYTADRDVVGDIITLVKSALEQNSPEIAVRAWVQVNLFLIKHRIKPAYWPKPKPKEATESAWELKMQSAPPCYETRFGVQTATPPYYIDGAIVGTTDVEKVRISRTNGVIVVDASKNRIK